MSIPPINPEEGWNPCIVINSNVEKYISLENIELAAKNYRCPFCKSNKIKLEEVCTTINEVEKVEAYAIHCRNCGSFSQAIKKENVSTMDRSLIAKGLLEKYYANEK